MKPNLLLITVDQMRGDCIAALGHPDISTPNLDTMIRHGVAFTNAYSASPTCIPARAALFTGLAQEHHGRVGYQDGVPWNYSVTMPGVFADAGYHTHCAGKLHVWPPRSLMGFHSVDLHDGFLPHRNTATPASGWWNRVDDYLPWLRQQVGYDADLNDSGIGANSWAARPWPLPEHTHPTNWVVDRSLEFFRRRDPTKPFFLWSSFVAPHPPLLPPPCYLEEYLSLELTPPVIGSWADEVGAAHPEADCFEGRLSRREIHRMQAGYYGLITHLDHQIGRLLRAMKDEGLLQNTVVLFTSDHGEMLGDHHMFRKSQAFQGSVSVPLLLYDPSNLLDLPQGSRCASLAELRDVMPTLLDAAGLDIPAGLDGVSLLSAAHGTPTAREFLHGEHTSQQNTDESVQYIVTEREKYIWFSGDGREMLFDLQDDPGELYDLALSPDRQDLLQTLRWHLIQSLQGREEGFSDGSRLIPGQKARTVLNHLLKPSLS